MKISIITISYNQATYLEQAIRSVIDQDYPEIEYIVVDPGSTDGSRDIIENYRDRIDNIIFKPDKGPANGLNNGFARATGDIFAYINSDDYYEPGAFSCVVNYFLLHSNIDVLSGAIKIVDIHGSAQLRKRTSDPFNLKKFVTGTCMIAQQATFFRSKTYRKTDGFNQMNKTCWDAELLVDMALCGSSFSSIRKVLGNFRIHDESISGSGRLFEQYLRDRKRIRTKVENNGIKMYSPFFEKIQGLIYKVSLKRHFLYLTAH